MLLNRRLPQELLDMIVDYLQNDPASLKQCALVGRSWVYPSQRHLFHCLHIGIRFDHAADSPRLLHECLCRSPHLAKHVRHLRITIHDQDEFNSAQQQLIAIMLPMFYRLTGLALRCPWETEFNMDIMLLEGIRNTILSPLMKHVTMDELGEFMNLSHFTSLLGKDLPSLTSLQLRNIYIQSASTDPPSQKNETDPIEIQSLEIEGCSLGPLTTWFAMLQRPVRIKHLSLECYGSSEEVSPLLALFSSSLEELDLSTEDIDMPVVDLSTLTKLRILSLPYEDDTSLLETIETVSTSNHIESIDLRMFRFFNHFGIICGQLDQILASARFHCLKMVKLVIGQNALNTEDFRLIKKSMRLLIGRGILHVSFSTGELLTSEQIRIQASSHEVFYPTDFPLFLQILKADDIDSAIRIDAPASLGFELFSQDFLNSVASTLEDFDTGIFRPDGDINFERDFGQWFNGNDDNVSGEEPQPSNPASNPPASFTESLILPPLPSFPPPPWSHPPFPSMFFTPLDLELPLPSHHPLLLLSAPESSAEVADSHLPFTETLVLPPIPSLPPPQWAQTAPSHLPPSSALSPSPTDHIFNQSPPPPSQLLPRDLFPDGETDSIASRFPGF